MPRRPICAVNTGSRRIRWYQGWVWASWFVPGSRRYLHGDFCPYTVSSSLVDIYLFRVTYVDSQAFLLVCCLERFACSILASLHFGRCSFSLRNSPKHYYASGVAWCQPCAPLNVLPVLFLSLYSICYCIHHTGSRTPSCVSFLVVLLAYEVLVMAACLCHYADVGVA